MNFSSLEELFKGFEPEPGAKPPVAVQKALFLACRLQQRAAELQTPPEKRQQAELDRMLQTPSDKATLAQVTDQAFRTNDPHRAVEHLIHILDVREQSISIDYHRYGNLGRRSAEERADVL